VFFSSWKDDRDKIFWIIKGAQTNKKIYLNAVDSNFENQSFFYFFFSFFFLRDIPT